MRVNANGQPRLLKKMTLEKAGDNRKIESSATKKENT